MQFIFYHIGTLGPKTYSTLPPPLSLTLRQRSWTQGFTCLWSFLSKVLPSGFQNLTHVLTRPSDTCTCSFSPHILNGDTMTLFVHVHTGINLGIPNMYTKYCKIHIHVTVLNATQYSSIKQQTAHAVFSVSYIHYLHQQVDQGMVCSGPGTFVRSWPSESPGQSEHSSV